MAERMALTVGLFFLKVKKTFKSKKVKETFKSKRVKE